MSFSYGHFTPPSSWWTNQTFSGTIASSVAQEYPRWTSPKAKPTINTAAYSSTWLCHAVSLKVSSKRLVPESSDFFIVTFFNWKPQHLFTNQPVIPLWDDIQGPPTSPRWVEESLEDRGKVTIQARALQESHQVPTSTSRASMCLPGLLWHDSFKNLWAKPAPRALIRISMSSTFSWTLQNLMPRRSSFSFPGRPAVAWLSSTSLLMSPEFCVCQRGWGQPMLSGKGGISGPGG